VKRFLLLSLVSSVFCAAFLFSTEAAAQVHWDVGAEVGGMKRFLTGGPDGAPDAGFGAVGELHAHVALIPIVRVGAYLAHDISPLSGTGGRGITSGGLHLRITSPWPTGKWRGWAFLGFGYAGVYAPSYHAQQTVPDPNFGTKQLDTFIEGSTGSYWEVPLGFSIAYKAAKPLELVGSLGTRLGFSFAGDVYNDRAGHAANQPPLDIAAVGNDSVAVFLTLGVNFEM
jgi:hypothetical protein